MPQPLPETDPFPPSEFDQWAGQYDRDVDRPGFPFTGYRRVLSEVVRQAQVQSGMAVLDLGAGTGNLAGLFLALGCEVWCTDFSREMIDRARVKFPAARFFLHDLRQPFPPGLARRFDRITSAYVFHHFELPEKVALLRQLLSDRLEPDGQILIADVSFPTGQALDTARQAAGEGWDEERYWVAAEALPALETLGATLNYTQVSDCAGIYQLSK
ncbi:methylase [Longilinea arvoryzae]|uniref:Methylase n=1 Tax=Longilinea arvoryzae TaxID=360412 RepID=A0A0S7B5I6_9CHLR|nr:class I SAM-dependent methyltransferase [Longilinea arvoryzae]GAP12444.1 methylase [Longilinea arvoryzae]